MLASDWSILAGRRQDPHNRSVSPILQTRFKPKLAIVVRKYYPHSAPPAASIPKQQPGWWESYDSNQRIVFTLILSQAQLQNNARQVKTFSCHYHNWNTTAASNAVLHTSKGWWASKNNVQTSALRTWEQLENSRLSKFKVASRSIMI